MKKNINEDIQFLEKPKDEFLVLKKISTSLFLFKEFFVFFLISFASFFSIYISANNLNSEEIFSKSLLMTLNYFTFNNFIHTCLGLFIVMGLIGFFNHLITASYLNIQTILNRLIASVVDFYYLMLSTMLGAFFSLHIFLYKNPNTKDYSNLYETSVKGLIIIGIVGSLTAVLLQYLMKIKEIKP